MTSSIAAATSEIVRIAPMGAPDIRVLACLEVDHGGFSVLTERPVARGRVVHFQFETSAGLIVTVPATSLGCDRMPAARPHRSLWEFIVEPATRDAIGLLATAVNLKEVRIH